MSKADYFWKKKQLVSYVLSVYVFWAHCSSFYNYPDLPLGISLVRHFFTAGFNSAAVPLFMIISGAVFFRDFSMKNYLPKLRRRLLTLLAPYLSWNILNMLFEMLATRFLSQYFIGRQPFVWSLKNILLGIFHYRYNDPFWFIFALMAFTLAAPLIDLLLKNKWTGAAGILILVYVKRFGIGLPQPLFFNGTCLLFYLTGCWIGRYAFDLFSTRRSRRGALLCLLGAVPLLTYEFWSTWVIHDLPTVAYHLETCGIGLFVWGAFDLLPEDLTLPKFTEGSFWVYALHVNAGAVFAKLLYLALPKGSIWSIPNFALTTLLTLTCIEILRRLTGKYLPPVYRILSGSRG